MSGIIDSLAHPGLEKATEVTFGTANSYLGRILAAKFYYDLGIIWFVTGFVGLNTVTSIPFTVDTPESKIDEVLKRLAASGETITWHIGPSMRATKLEERLEANGWSKGEEIPSLALDLYNRDVPLESLVESPAGLTIELVSSDEAFKEHVNMMVVGFEFSEPIVQYISNLHYGHEMLEDPAVYYYLGRMDGKPVAISLLFLCEGIASIYNVATHPRMRHRGIGRAMTLTPLLKARDLGYRVAVLQTSSMGLNLYRSLGFQDYCTFSTYLNYR